jgi:hypothetical protein
VTFGGLATGGIRISHMSHIDKETVVVVMKSKGKKAGVKILPLRVEAATKESSVQQTAELTIDQARADIAAALDLPALEVVWRRKSMAPFRDELKGALDAQKAALSFEPEGRTDADHGDQHDSVADDLNDERGGE